MSKLLECVVCGFTLLTGGASAISARPHARTRRFPSPIVGTWSNVQQGVEYQWTYRPDHTLTYVEGGRMMWWGRWRDLGNHWIEELLVFSDGAMERRRTKWQLIDDGRGIEFSDPTDPNSIPGRLFRVRTSRAPAAAPQRSPSITAFPRPDAVSIALDRHSGRYRVDKLGAVFLDPYGGVPVRLLIRNREGEPVTVRFEALRYLGRKPREGLVVGVRKLEPVVVPPHKTRAITLDVYCKEVRAEPATFVFRVDQSRYHWSMPYTLRYQPDPGSE